MTKRIESHILSLDQNFIPMARISRKKAIKAIVTGRAEILNLSTWERITIVDQNSQIKAIVYPHVRAISENKLKVGSVGRGVIHRDKVCQYDNCQRKAVTVDHVIPRCHGGQSTWSNLVGCCMECNQRKGPRTPEQAGMKLKGPIKSPRYILHEEFRRAVEKEQEANCE